MDNERFVAGQRKAVNLIFVMSAGFIVAMWVAAVCDWAFNLGWGSDTQIIWLAPPMLLFGAFIRFCCMAIFRFIGGNSSGR